MEKNYFYIDIVPVLVEEVFEEVGHALKRYMPTDHDVPAKRGGIVMKHNTICSCCPRLTMEREKQRDKRTKNKQRNEMMSEEDA